MHFQPTTHQRYLIYILSRLKGLNERLIEDWALGNNEWLRTVEFCIRAMCLHTLLGLFDSLADKYAHHAVVNSEAQSTMLWVTRFR